MVAARRKRLCRQDRGGAMTDRGKEGGFLSRCGLEGGSEMRNERLGIPTV